ncbi:hypothetical protein [Agrobacterium sp.]|uniref:hypothetical protein n=1 Tax=Agrobacterium sp. TaxID=361 RepID=UPI0028A1F9FC|nr:hypothetical protein [Agrobacterium sp.]
MSITIYESAFHSYLPKEEADAMCAKIEACIKLREFFGPKFNSLTASRRIGISRLKAKKLVEAKLDEFNPRKMEVWIAWLKAERSLALDELARLDQEAALI